MYLMTIALTMVSVLTVFAQSESAKPYQNHLTGKVKNDLLKNNGNALPSTQALWDIQFNYNASTAVGSAGNAGVAYTGTEFWVSRWQNDTIYTLSPTGTLTSTFTIPGITGIRAFTWDGQYLYAGKNTATISVIDPQTKTEVNTIAVAGGTLVRHITYDSTANAGAGGFWIGNFSTALIQIDMNGNTLNTIPAATHGLTAMYGTAIDHWTSGGPYLWVFDQGGASQAQIVRLQLPSGIPTGLVHDVMTDVGTGVTGGLAGGLFITNQLDTTRTIVGLLQGTPNRLFGYELNDYTLPAVDGALDTLRSNVPYYQIPLTHVLPMNFTGSVRNAGANPVSGTLNIEVTQGITPLFSANPAFTNLSSGASANVTTSTLFTPGSTGSYNTTGLVMVANDASALNDTIKFTFMVTDTVFARETEIAVTSSLGIGNGTGGILGQRFTTSVVDIATSVSFYLTSPTAGDTVSAGLYSFSNVPGAALGTTPQYIIQPADTNGIWLTLPFSSGPVTMPVGNYFVGVREYSDNITLGTTPVNFRPAAGWVNIAPASAWNTTEFYGFNRTYLLRLNVGNLSGIEDGIITGITTVYPNPTTGMVVISANKNIEEISVANILGESLHHTRINSSKHTLNLAGFTPGIYFVKSKGADFVNINKIIVE